MLRDDRWITIFAAGTSYSLLLSLATILKVPHGILASVPIGAISGLAGYLAREAYLIRHPGGV